MKRIALAQLRAERAGHTLQPTALVHEAYLRILGQRELDWRDRAHFFGLAAMTMRRILVDHARKRNSAKRGSGEVVPLTITTDGGGAGGAIADVPLGDVELLDLDRALVRFAEESPRAARVVELRFFGGLTYEEAATALDISTTTLDRELRLAKAWLRHRMRL